MALNPRQGGSVLIPVPFARPEDVTAEAPDGLVIRPIVRDANDQVNVELFVPDATPLGDDSFRRIVTITTTIAGETFVRNVHITVGAITASSTGHDENDGSPDHPFATFGKAISVAKAGDTIALFGFNDPPTHPCSAPVDSTAITVPSGVTVVGHDSAPSTLPMNVQLAGDATLQSVLLTGARLVLSTPGSNVTLLADRVVCGITVDETAKVAEGLAGTHLSISASTQVINDPNIPESPLIVQAAGASVTIDNGSSIVTSGIPSFESIRLNGGSQSLEILSNSFIQNPTAHAALLIVDSATAKFDQAIFFGRVEISDPKSSVSITRSKFTLGATSGELVFRGHDLRIADSSFTTGKEDEGACDGVTMCDGIIQDNPDSVVTITNTTFGRYQNFGYKLLGGNVQINGSSFTHDATAALTDTGPFAIVVDSPWDTPSFATSNSSKYDVVVPLMPCSFTGGQKSQPGLFSISATSNMGGVAFN